MGLINKFGPCWGITLYRFFQYRAEIWYCPSNYKIIEHRHPQEDVELCYLFGSCSFYRRDITNGQVDSMRVGWFNWLKKFSVKSFHSHWFSVGKWPLIFINFQTFNPYFKPKSAAKDFLV